MTPDTPTPVPHEDRAARAALTAVAEPGRPALLQALQSAPAAAVLTRLRGGDPRLDRDGRLARLLRDVDGEAVLARGDRAGLGFVVPGDERWPAEVDALEGVLRDGRGGPPLGLWTRGDLSLLAPPPVALGVVGSRAATSYGVGVATDWAADLAAGGLVVVSGAAYGIDAAAHRGALAAGGLTVAIMAGGLDVPYPRGNAHLIDRIGVEGLLVSECAPGAGVNRGRFLLRNRLVAALSQVVLVVEAGTRSGALSTAAWAAGLLRPVAAVPGPVTSAMSLGAHRLIRDQAAVLVGSPDDVRELVGAYGDIPEAAVPPARDLDGLPEPLLTIREAMPARRPVSLAELVASTGLTLPVLLAGLDALTQRRLVVGVGETWTVCAPRRPGS